MIRSLWTAATGMAAQNTNVDVISNNLANVNTAGFKKSRANFEDLMYQQIKTPGSEASSSGTQVPSGIQIGLGVRTVATQSMFTEGSFQQTGNQFDLAIEGKGFFQLQLADGTTAYTRNGSFSLDSQGQIVTQNGDILQPALSVPTDTIRVDISADGTVTATQPNAVSSVLGQIQLVDFSNPSGLVKLGRSLYQETNASGAAATSNAGSNGVGTLQQGSLEMSNVNVVEEMVNLIAGQRAYEMNSKAVQAADEMLQSANNIKR